MVSEHMMEICDTTCRGTDPTTLLRDLKVEQLAIADLKPYPRNARTHSAKQIRQIAESFKTFGFTNPILIDGDGRIMAGHGRVEAAKLLKLETVPAIRINDLSEADKRAYIIADNRLAELAGWDEQLLSIELQYLSDIEVDFEVEITGFDTVEIDQLIEAGNHDAKDDEADIVPDLDDDRPPVTRAGDLWLLGKNRLFNGDARLAGSYDAVMCGDQAQMVFTDPPYNVRIGGHACGSGAIKHNEFVMASGEMSEDEFVKFLAVSLGHHASYSKDGAIHFVCIDWRHLYELLIAGRSVYTELKNLCVWNKDNGGMGTFYRSKHELVLVLKNGTAPHINNFELGQKGRYRTNVWDYPGANTPHRDRLEELRMHPTVKPVALVADAIRDCSRRDGLVLDGFAGSGTTIIAAERTGRRANAVELDSKFVDVAVRRWEAFTGGNARHAATGLSFAEMTIARNAQVPMLPAPDPAPSGENEEV
jgi:DNA modification methylase